MPRHLLLTGGAGFVGAHLAARLLDAGRTVTVLDDLSAPAARAGSARLQRQAARLDPSAEAGPLRLTVADVRDAAALERAAAGCDALVHLASVVGVDAVTAEPERTGSVIRDGTARVLDLARARGLPLMHFSSSEVTDGPRRGPRAVYGEAKRDAEALLLDAARDLAVTIVRPFNIVGPGQDAPGMVLPTLARAARVGAPLPVHGDGRQERSFLHVDDLVDATLALLDQAPRPGGRIVEVGSEERITIAGLAERLVRLAGTGASIAREASPAPREDRPRRAPDLTALRALVSFRPRWALDGILRQALARA